MFKFKNNTSTEMKVIVEEEDDSFLSASSSKYEIIDIDGKDGAEYNELGYSNIEKDIKLAVLDLSKLDSIFSWLKGPGELIYKGKKTNAFFFDSIEPKRSASIKTISLSYIREYYWAKEIDDYVIVTSTVRNEGNLTSKPIIRLEKNAVSIVELSINGVRFKYTFPENENYVEIDSKTYSVLYEGLSRNRQIEIDYNYPFLKPGSNEIITYAGEPIVKIKRKDFWL